MPVGHHSLSRERKNSFHLSMKAACSILCLAGSICISQPASAQQKIEEMIVTAQKRSQDLQTVPASISAFSGEGLEKRQIKTLTDLGQTTPNLILGTNFSVPQISIRGVSTDNYSPTTDTTVAVHIDGVYQPRAAGLLVTMQDLDSVEVLRGPQGTVYGRNANAGVINLITAKPTDEFEGKATLFGGSYERYGAKGYVSGPITDKISARLFAVIDRQTGWAKNLTTGNRADGDYLYGSRLSVRLKPTDDVTVDVSANYSFDHNTKVDYPMTPPKGFVYDSVVLSGAGGAQLIEPYRFTSPIDPSQVVTTGAISATVNWDIAPNLSLKSVTGAQKVSQNIFIDIENLAIKPGFPPYFADGQPDFKSHSWSQEFDLNAKLWDRVDLVAGLYYMYDMMEASFPTNTLPGGIPYSATGPAWIIYSGLPEHRSTSKAAFVDVTLSVTDDLRLLGGVRRTLDHREDTVHYAYTFDGTDATAFGPCSLANPVGSGFHGTPTEKMPDLDYHSTTGRVGLQYDFTPDIMGYVQWQNGFKTGGWNSGGCENNYKPENIRSWEAGIKTTFFSDTLQVNASVFDYTYVNMQLNRTIGGTSPASLIDNAASAKIRGGELEVNAYLTDELKANVSVGYLSSHYGSLSAVNPAYDSPVPVSITGNTIPRAPKWSLNAGIEYAMRAGDFGELTPRVEYSYLSKQYNTIFQEPYIGTQAGYSLWNAYLTFEPDDCPYRFQIYAKNITGKAYALGGQMNGIFQSFTGYWGPPRIFGAEASVKF